MNIHKFIFIFRKIIWWFGFDFHKIGGYYYIHSLIYNNYPKDFTFLQIGAYDGISFDPIYNLVNYYKLKGYCLEPIEIYYNKLLENYKQNPNVVPLKFAIYEKSGKFKFYRRREDSEAEKWTFGMSSLVYEHHLRNGVDSSKIEEIEVDALTFDDFFKLYPVDRIDLLQIDTEGYDYNLIKIFPFARFMPKIIHFEHGLPKNFMTKEQVAEIINLLISMDYQIVTKQFDILAFRD